MEKEKERSNKNIKIGMIISYVTLAVSILIYLFFTPYCLNQLGDSEYGLRSFATSISSYLTILSFGISSTYIRYRLVAIKKEGEEGEKRFNGLYFLVFVVIGLISLILGVVIVFLLKYNVIPTTKYTNAEKNILYRLVFILIVNVSLSFPLGVFTQFSTAKEKFIWTRSMVLLTDILTTLFGFIVLFFGYKSIAMTLVTLGVSVVIGLLNIFYSIHILKMKFNFKLKKDDLIVLKDMLNFSLFVGLNLIVDELNSQADPLIIGFMLGAKYVTIFNIGRQFRSYLGVMSTTISSSFAPRIYEYELSGEKEKVNNLFNLVCSLQLIILFFIVGGFAACGKEFILSWLGESKIESYYVAIPIMAVAIVPLSQNISIEVQRAMKKHKFRAYAYLIIALINVGSSILLCHFIGMMGCVIGTVFSLIVGQYICINIYNQKVIGLPIKQYWVNYLRFLIPTLVSVLLAYCLDFLKPYISSTLLLFFAKGTTFVLSYLVINLLFNKKILKRIYTEFRYGEM